MGYLRSVQPLIAATIADLPSSSDVAAHPGLGDAIIFVDEDGSARRWDAGSSSWTRRGGPVIPVPMSQLSAPLKAQSDALAATGYATAAQGTKADSALQNAAVFASALQGVKADSALQSVLAASYSSPGLMSVADYTNLQFLVSLTAYSRRPQVVRHSVSIATANSDALIITDMPAKYLVTRLSVFDASSALSTVMAGLYTGAAGVGAIVGPSTIMAANASAFFDYSSLPLIVRTNTPLYFHVTVPKAATTISLLIEFLNLT